MYSGAVPMQSELILEEDLPLPPFQEVFALVLAHGQQQPRYSPYTASLLNNRKRNGKSLSVHDSRYLKKSKDDGNRDHDESTGRWTAEEHNKFLEGVMKYGKDWKKMQPLIKTRSLVQIRTHAQKVFKKIGLKKLAGQSMGSLTSLANQSMATTATAGGSDGTAGAGEGLGMVSAHSSKSSSPSPPSTLTIPSAPMLDSNGGSSSSAAPALAGTTASNRSGSTAMGRAVLPSDQNKFSNKAGKRMSSSSGPYFDEEDDNLATEDHDNLDVDDDEGEEDLDDEDETNDDDPLLVLANSYTQLIQHHGHLLQDMTVHSSSSSSSAGVNNGSGGAAARAGLSNGFNGGDNSGGGDADNLFHSDPAVHNVLGLEHDDQMTVQLLQTLQTFVNDQHNGLDNLLHGSYNDFLPIFSQHSQQQQQEHEQQEQQRQQQQRQQQQQSQQQQSKQQPQQQHQLPNSSFGASYSDYSFPSPDYLEASVHPPNNHPSNSTTSSSYKTTARDANSKT